MIAVLTRFQLPKAITHEEARRTLLSTAPKYQGVIGLFRKYYYLSEDRKTVGGIYLWNSRAEAEAQRRVRAWCTMARRRAHGFENTREYRMLFHTESFVAISVP
jgi:hypothetical protein